MINSIVSIFREQAQSHKAIRSFYYDRNYEIGSGNESHPVFWLEDPVTGRNQSNLFITTVNFCILFIPDRNNDVSTLQNLAFSAGLNIIERIKQDEASTINILPTWTYMTLREYYDNDACGCRFTVEFSHLNMQNLCLIEEQFDDSARFEQTTVDASLFDFRAKLPVFNLKTSK